MWLSSKHHKYGIVIHNYYCEQIAQSLKLDIGECVQILEENDGWYRGFSTKNKSIRGIFPSTFIHLRPFKIENEGLSEVVVPIEDSVVSEAASVLKEWGQIWKKLYISLRAGENEYALWNAIRKTMLDLANWRKQLITGTMTSDQMTQLKLKITRKIDWGNRKLGLDLVPRVNGEMVHPDAVSIVELYQVHAASEESTHHHNIGFSTIAKKKPKPKIEAYHLYMHMQDFSCNVGEDMEIFFSLYDGSPNKMGYISEKFLVKHPKEGFSNYIERIDSNCTIFTDLGNKDIASDLYIVAYVVRVGRMLASESSKKTSQQQFRRPFGVAVFKHSLEGLKTVEQEIELSSKMLSIDEKDMWQLPEMFIKKQTNKYSVLPNSTSAGMVVNVKLLQGELEQAIKANPLLLKSICVTRKMGFSDIIMPGEVRNDLYITLSHGEFERGGKSVGKNIEVTVYALDMSGKPIKCIHAGTGQEPTSQFSSTIFYHNNAPQWKEQIKIAIPIEKFSKAHLRMEFRHCSTREKNEKKLFSFSFLRLMEDEGGTTLRNGSHELCVYKCEDRSRLIVPAEYMSCPFLAKAAVDCVYTLPFHRSPKETVVVETLLCSTKLTQNVDLLSLLRWKSSPDGIGETLTRIVKIDGSEIVKFLQDVLDALFGMFSTEHGNSTQYSGHVFHALVSIFCLLEDSKYKHFKPVIDAYLAEHFAAPLVYKGLISCIKHLADLCPNTEKQDPILNCFCSLEYIFKFIIQSRILFVKAVGIPLEDSFAADLDEVFGSFTYLLGLNQENIIYTQIALLEHIQGALDQMYKVLDVVAVIDQLKTLLDSTSIDAPPNIMQAKLHAIKHAISLTVFEDDDGRALFLRTACSHLRQHLMLKQEIGLCAELVANIIILTHKQTMPFSASKIPISLREDIKTISLNIVDVIIQCILHMDVKTVSYRSSSAVCDLNQLLQSMSTINAPGHGSVHLKNFNYKEVEQDMKCLGTLIACLMGMFQLMRAHHYNALWETQITTGSLKQLRSLLLSCTSLLDQLVRSPIFPADWFVMRLATNSTILTAMQEIAQPLITSYLKGQHFDNQLWSTYFNLAVGFLTQKSLQLEHFSQEKKQKVLEKYNDMRVLMGFQILSMWHNLDEQRLYFIPGMVGPFLEVTLVPEPELRKATLPIFFDMMQAEQQSKGNFKQVETELIDKLDILVSENKGDDEYRQLFNTILLERVKSDDPVWRDSGTAFINSVTRLLERLLDYRNVMQGDENCDKRMSCTVNLLNFYKNEINRQEMYVRYIYKLHDLHLPAGNYIEAGFTLLLHAKQLSWSQKVLHADHLYAAQTEFQRKETIYYRVIECFNKGKCWEQGIPLLEELVNQYSTKVFNYKKLSEAHRLLAAFYEHILNSERHTQEYFRVGFYGSRFPLFVRNKMFIYRGMEFESISEFTLRIQTEFSQAKLLPHNTPPDDATRTADDQYIQICVVKPMPEPRPEFEGIEVEEAILKYYNHNQVKRFVLDRPVHKGPMDKENEFKSLWIERIVYRTENELPGILKWFEVAEQTTEQVCPPQYACETMEKNCQQIRHMIAHYNAHPKDNIQPFTMRLQGSIDAAVNGGIAKYQEAFFKNEYLLLNPHFGEHVVKLKSLIAEQTLVLERALDLHGRIAPLVNQPLHRRLMEVFEDMRVKVQRMCSTPQSQRSTSSLQHMPTPPLTHRRADSDPAVEFRRIGSIINSPLPPVPCERKESVGTSSSTSGHSSQRSSQGSSLYAHFHSVSHEEDLYSKPSVYEDAGTLTRDPRQRSSYLTDSRSSSPRSFSLSTSGDYMMVPSPRPADEYRRPKLSRPSSPRTARDILNSSWSDSYSQGSHESLPPLPPRIGNERNSRSVSLGGDDDIPPQLPKRIHKKASMGSMISHESEVSNGYSPSTPLSPPTLSPRHHVNSFPPPLPPKSSLSNPISPGTPSSTSTFCPLESSQEELSESHIETYSVPPRLSRTQS